MKIKEVLFWLLLLVPILGYAIWASVYTWDMTRAEMFYDIKLWFGAGAVTIWFFLIQFIEKRRG